MPKISERDTDPSPAFTLADIISHIDILGNELKKIVSDFGQELMLHEKRIRALEEALEALEEHEFKNGA